jgi:outer membrane protein insertion porin family
MARCSLQPSCARYFQCAGEIFDTSKVRTGLENLRKVYGTRGYINFPPVPDTSVDDDAGKVSLVIDLDEGKQFRIGSVKIFGLDWNRTTRLLCGWPLKPGTIYQMDVIEGFFRSNKAWLSQEALSRMEIVRNEKASTVDVLLNFSSGNAPGVEVEARPEIVYVPEKAPKR